jgi:hypothetical protein
MKNYLPLLALAVLAVGCDAMEGTLSIHEALNVKVKKTGIFQSGLKDLSIPAQTYTAKLNPTSDTNINLELNVGGKDQKIPFKILKGTTLPEREGKLEILSSTSGQPYDLEANVTTDVSSFESSQNESCVARYYPEQRCYTTLGIRDCHIEPGREVCNGGLASFDDRDHHDRPGHEQGRWDNNGPIGPGPTPGPRSCYSTPGREVCFNRPPMTECRIEQVAVYGNHLVTYSNITSVRHVTVDIVIPAGAHVGQFNYSATTNTKIQINSTQCL